MTEFVTKCLHQDRHPVWADRSAYGGPMEVRQLREQCSTCGKLFGQAIAHAKAGPDTPNADMEAAERFLKLEQAEREMEREAERLIGGSGVVTEDDRAWYRVYLTTELWRDRRAVVLKRANYICEGCGINRATEVHHLTYANVCQEFNWQLVAICRDCHERYHRKGRWAEGAS